MSGVWRKTLVYLGLVEEPEEHDELPEQFEEPDPPPATEEPDRPGGPEPPPDREVPRKVRPLRVPEPGAAHVRAVSRPTASQVAVVQLREFDDVEEVGARYRGGQPVVFDLAALERPVARRVLDFVSGMTYALHGDLSSAGARAFLLVPEGVEISSEERGRLAELGYRGMS